MRRGALIFTEVTCGAGALTFTEATCGAAAAVAGGGARTLTGTGDGGGGGASAERYRGGFATALTVASPGAYHGMYTVWPGPAPGGARKNTGAPVGVEHFT